MYNKEFKGITDASQKNIFTIFVVTGVSTLSKAPKWLELIDSFCGELYNVV